MAANKSDLFANEAVSEEKARNFAKEIGAVFKLTSACTSTGVDKLFYNVGCKYLDPNFKDDDDATVNQGNEKKEENKKEEVSAPVQSEEKKENKEVKKDKPKESENKDQKKGMKLTKANTKPKKKKKCC